ncbi:alcohol dehydrogenase catalytic domain-containing protein [Oceanicola sp. 502str15]|uniref:alcohol dehydrogenase catalytic domain-containing protein n=1 Tax=Oceanicola sp. 502str15 TaxID=2696061 RepID=UPI002094E278|nr:alcohol dehydrogenase catalytic domain-containing protein [Oceanicola sp. 502str15]MCO6383520.1 alcohol dehydrogenase catalytic domain-containing protein [Oceanicola sp. 502str15]
MTTIRAAVARSFGSDLTIEEVELATPGAGQVEVALEAVAICHSDIHFAEGAWGGGLPAVYGHEAVGRVTATGPGVQGLDAGARVLVTMLRACGHCGCCASGTPVYCETGYDRQAQSPISQNGAVVNHGLSTGAFAERVVVDQSQLAPLPEDIPATSACLLACGVITGVGAVVNTAKVRPGETVVVIGAGGVGLNAIQGARISGAAKIVAIDMSAEKLDAAMEFGATHGILASAEKPWRDLFEIAPKGADAVFVSVGAVPAYETALRYVGTRGRVYAVGMPHSGERASWEPVIVAALGQRIHGTLLGEVVLKRDIPWMVELYRQGRLKLDELVSGTWALEQINEAIADTKAGGARRNVIVF